MEAAPEGFVYVADFLSAEEQAALLRELRALQYQHDTFRGQRLSADMPSSAMPMSQPDVNWRSPRVYRSSCVW